MVVIIVSAMLIPPLFRIVFPFLSLFKIIIIITGINRCILPDEYKDEFMVIAQGEDGGEYKFFMTWIYNVWVRRREDRRIGGESCVFLF